MKIVIWVFVFISILSEGVSIVAAADELSDSEDAASAKWDGVAYQVAGGKLVARGPDGTETIVIERGVISIYDYRNKIYAALGEDGVAIIPLEGEDAGTVEAIIPVSHGKVTALSEMEGRLWMHIDSTSAVLLHDSQMSPKAPTTILTHGTIPKSGASPALDDSKKRNVSEPTTTEQVLQLEIVRSYSGKVKLNKGAADGVKVGDRFDVYRTGDVSGQGVDEFEGDKVIAVLVVEAVNERSCLAQIWRGDRVRLSDTVRSISSDKDASLVYPRKFDGIAEVTSTVRPIINVGEKGFGALCDLGIAYYSAHLFADFRIQPLGFGWNGGSKVVTNSMVLSGGYNGRAFAVGVGLGITSVNGDLSEMMSRFGGFATSDSYEPRTVSEWRQSTRHAFSLAQRVRLGAQEGLNVTVNNTLLYYNSENEDDTPSGFIYAGTTGRITWPLALRTDMFLEGGGGVMGYGFGALGVFSWIRGNGDAGSIGISASAGGAGIWSEKEREVNGYIETENVSIAGPMFSLGMTYRFGAAK